MGNRRGVAHGGSKCVDNAVVVNCSVYRKVYGLAVFYNALRILAPGRARRLQDVGVRRWRMADRRSARPRPHFEIVGRARLAPGVVVWARVPYADRDDYKIRPAAVVARQTRHSDHRMVVCDLFLDP